MNQEAFSKSTPASIVEAKPMPSVTTAFKPAAQKHAPAISNSSSMLVAPLPILPRPQPPVQPQLQLTTRSLRETAPAENAYSSGYYIDKSVSRRASEPLPIGTTTLSSSTDVFHTSIAMKRPITTMTSAEILAEKRRRNAGASARFRDRRKQKEKDLSDRCQFLERRNKDLQAALRLLDPQHVLLLPTNATTTTTTTTTTTAPSSFPSIVSTIRANSSVEKNNESTSSDQVEEDLKISTTTAVGSDGSNPSVFDLWSRVKRLEEIILRTRDSKMTSEEAKCS